MNGLLKLTASKSLPKLPITRHHVVACESSTVTGCDLKRQALAIKVRVALPILAPVPRHGLPPCFRPFDRHCMNISCSADVGDQHQVEVRVSINGESYPSFLHTRHPAKKKKKSHTQFTHQTKNRVSVKERIVTLPSKSDRDDPSSVLCNLQESRLGQVKVLERRIAPPAIVVRQSKVWRTEVGSSDSDGPGKTPSWVIVASHFVARTTAQAIVEKGSAQCCGVGSVPLAV